MLLLRIFAFMTILAGISFNLFKEAHSGLKLREVNSLKEVFPQADSFSSKIGSPPCYRVYKNKRFIGICYTTLDVVPEIKGYGGHIDIMVGLAKSGKITGIEILKHKETPSYVTAFKEYWFINQFKGKDIRADFEIGKDVDAITRATISSQAVTNSLKKSARMMASSVFGIQFPRELEKKRKPPWDLFLLFVLFFLAGTGYIKKKANLRYVTFVLGIGLVGYYKVSPISIVNIADLTRGIFPDYRTNLFLFVLLIIAIGSTFFIKRFYCHWICPFGAIQELIKKVNPKPTRIDATLEKRWSNLKYFILWATLVGILFTGKTGIGGYEPFTPAFAMKGTVLVWLLFAVIIIGSFLIYRFWCRFLCPVGAFLGILSRVRPSKRKIKDEW